MKKTILFLTMFFALTANSQNQTLTGVKTYTGRIIVSEANAAVNTNSPTPLIVTGGAGGNTTATSGTATAGNAGEIKLMGGAGGNALTSSNTNLGGNAGPVYLLGGDGGLATGGSLNFPGRGGDATLQGGDSWGGVPGFASVKGGNNKISGSFGGDVYIVPGWGNNADAENSFNGTIFLGLSPNGSSLRGNTVIGGITDDKSNKLQVNGLSKFSEKATFVSNIQLTDPVNEIGLNVKGIDRGLAIEYDANPMFEYLYSGIFSLTNDTLSGTYKLDTSGIATTITQTPTDASGKIPSIGFVAPLSSTDTGVQGEIRVTAAFVFYCYATNLWTRVTAVSVF